MIDLHLHTTYSDGADSLIDILKKAEKNKLDYISITDHDNCNSYMEMREINIKEYYSGKIIPGIEIKCAHNGRLIEILGYKIDIDKMKKWCDAYYADKTKDKLQQKYFDMLYDRCLKMNLILDPKEKISFNNKKDWASMAIYSEIKKHPENKNRVPEDFWRDFNTFSKKYCGDKNHILYLDKSTDYPSVQEAIEAVKKCNGLVFLPHLFIYKWAEDIYSLIEEILSTYKVDGIECYHSEFNSDNIEYFKKMCKERNYLMSGGSDYHGINKPGIEMAIGKGNMHIPTDIISDWIDT